MLKVSPKLFPFAAEDFRVPPEDFLLDFTARFEADFFTFLTGVLSVGGLQKSSGLS